MNEREIELLIPLLGHDLARMTMAVATLVRTVAELAPQPGPPPAPAPEPDTEEVTP
jgi:hypothetical protein